MQLPQQLLLKLLLGLGMIAASAYCIVGLFIFIWQPRFIFLPSSVIEMTPEYFNLRYEEVWLPISVAGGKVERVHGWWIPSSQLNKQARSGEAPVLLYLHGNGINIGANIAHANRFHQLGFSVLLIDYRGYGRSEGSFPTEARAYEDAVTAWNYLLKQRKIQPSQIFIYGHSLGGAIAIDLAVQHPDAAGLIVESSFTSIGQVVADRRSFWMFPVNLLLTQRFDSISKVPRLQMPVLFIHGTADLVIPASMSQKLYAASPEPKQLILIPEAGHNNVAEVAGSQYRQGVLSFVQQVRNQQLAEP